MLTKIAHWLAFEPVRTYCYTVGGAGLLLLNGYGFLSDEHSALWGNLLAAVFVPAVEKARRGVRPLFRGTDDAAA